MQIRQVIKIAHPGKLRKAHQIEVHNYLLKLRIRMTSRKSFKNRKRTKMIYSYKSTMTTLSKVKACNISLYVLNTNHSRIMKVLCPK